MADLSDVEAAMVSIAASSLGLGDSYLAGSLVVSPAAGVKCRVFRGWPVANSLDADLAVGIANISVFPCVGATRNVTKYLPEWRQMPSAPPTVVATVLNNTVTFSGHGTPGQVVGVRYGPAVPVGGDPWSIGFSLSFGPLQSPSLATYRTVTGDTGVTIAAALASILAGASSSGPVLTLPTDYGVAAVVAPDIPELLETRRQEQQIDVIGWCPNPHSRDIIMSLIDAGFANMMDQFGRLTSQFGLPDGSNAFIRYVANRTNDAPQQATLWRRDLRYRVEYPTTLLEMDPRLIFGTINLSGGVDIVVTRNS